MTLYCQHTHRLRLQQGPGTPDIVSERPRNRRTELFLDGAAGTQIDIPDGLVGFDLGYALGVNAIAPLPCKEHPEAPLPPAPKPAVKTALTMPKGGSGG